MTLQLTTPNALDADTARAVRRAVSAAAAVHGSPPLSEQVLLDLHSGPPHQHVVLADGATFVAYAHADAADDSLVVELVASESLPSGMDVEAIAAKLVMSLDDRSRQLLLWAHGAESAAGRFARSAGWLVSRELLQLRRSLGPEDVELDEQISTDVSIRPFQIGDEPAVLAVNAAAFAHHPEQGSWTPADLQARTELDWFDPDGLLLAEIDGEVVGFHWTKVHADLDPPLGEVYVLGVHPSAQGRRVGAQLLRAGLSSLAGRGLRSVLLYVEADNVAAVQLYRKLGFTVFSTDVQYRAPRVG